MAKRSKKRVARRNVANRYPVAGSGKRLASSWGHVGSFEGDADDRSEVAHKQGLSYVGISLKKLGSKEKDFPTRDSGIEVSDGIFGAGYSSPYAMPLPDSIDEFDEVDATENDQYDWTNSPEEVIARLERPITSIEQLADAALFAEVLSFDETQKERLLNALWVFAMANRFARVEEIQVAVGSAVRKFAMNMPETCFEAYPDLLAPTSTDTLPCSLELEITKAVCWRLERIPPVTEADLPFPKLTAALSELASGYLTRRLVLQENYASIVCYATIGVCLLGGSRTDELTDRIARLRIDWFRELFESRLQVSMNQQGGVATDQFLEIQQRLHAYDHYPGVPDHASMES